MRRPVPEPAPGLLAGAVGAHAARTNATAATVTPMAGRDPRRLRQATRIPIPFPSPVQHDTTPAAGANACQAGSPPRRAPVATAAHPHLPHPPDTHAPPPPAPAPPP